MEDLIKECLLEIADEQLARSNPEAIPFEHRERRLYWVLENLPSLLCGRLAAKLRAKGVQMPWK